MEKIIYDNVSLDYIVNALTKGTIGLDDQDDHIDDYVIINKESTLFNEFAIKPTLIDITDSCLQSIGDLKLNIDYLDNTILEFIVIKVIPDEENPNKKVLVTQSLSETIIMFKESNIDLLSSTGWKLIQIN